MKKILIFTTTVLTAVIGLVLFAPNTYAATGTEFDIYLSPVDEGDRDGYYSMSKGTFRELKNLLVASTEVLRIDNDGTMTSFGESATIVSVEFNSDYDEINLFDSEGSSIIMSEDGSVNYEEGVHSHNGFDLTIIFKANPTQKPGISGKSTVINNIDSPYTIDKIKEIAMLKATDAYYGDLTDAIEVVSDTYTPNKSNVGDFEIEFKVTNPYGLSTTFILMVANKDITKPVITGPGTSTMSYTEEFVLSNLLAKFTVTDNHYKDLKVQVESTNHVEGKLGTFQYKLFAKDPSDNKGTFTHTLNVIDDVKPTFTDNNQGVIEVNWRDKVADSTLLMGITATDFIDGDLTSSIKVVENNIGNEVGKTYTVKYEVKDKAGNVAHLTRTYKIITTDSPVFWISKNLLLLSDVNNLTPDQLAAEIARYEGIQIASFSFIENDYEGNENVPGDYTIRLAIADVRGVEHIVERNMTVFAEADIEQPPLGFWAKIWNVIKSIFNWIINLFKAIFNFIIGLFKTKPADTIVRYIRL